MSITALSSGVPASPRYDFTNMTRKEALSAAGDLYAKGTISSDELNQIQGLCCNTAAVNPTSSGASGYGLDSPEKVNYQDLLLADLTAQTRFHSTSGAANDRALLSDLNPYFGSGLSKSEENASGISLKG